MKYIFFCLLSLAFISLTAQIQNEKGSIYLNDNEVLNGTIIFSYEQANQVFIKDSLGYNRSVSPLEIQQIKMDDGRRFVPGVINKDGQNITRIFEAILLSPKISLYRSVEFGQTVFFVSRFGNFQRIENNEVIRDKTEYNSQSKVKTYDYQYIRVLGPMMPDRFDLVQKLDKIQLNEKDLTRIIMEYNGGEVIYYRPLTEVYKKMDPNLLLFGQFSNHASFWNENTVDFSWGVMLGIQYYIASRGRSSFKLSFEYNTYQFDDHDMDQIDLGARFQFDMARSRRVNFYIIALIFDFGYVNTVNYSNESKSKILETNSNFYFYPEMSPGLGLELRPASRFAIYFELNRLLNLSYIPMNFTAGLKYDFGKKAQ